MITIQELLFNRGLDKRSKIKIVRHKDNRMASDSLYNIYRTNRKTFLELQSQQSKDVFKGIDYIVSFIGEEGTLSRFIGVFKIINCREFKEKQYSSIDGQWYHFLYDMEEVDGFDDLKERVIVRWENPISWHQWIRNDMEVVEIQPGLLYKQFTDYSDVILTFNELKEIVEKRYHDWKRILSAVKGIYLITDTKTGKLYVGSAYSDENGIWGRWRSYVSSNGHGGNKALIELIKRDVNYAQNFQFSILMILPKTATSDQAINKENLFKTKLGTNAFGLNRN